MEFPIKMDTVKSIWSIVYIEGSQVIVSEKYFSLKISFVSANGADPDDVAFHLGSHFAKLPIMGFLVFRWMG